MSQGADLNGGSNGGNPQGKPFAAATEPVQWQQVAGIGRWSGLGAGF